MLKLALKNLLRRQERCLITVAGIAVGIAALIVLIGISTGVRNAVIRSVMASGDGQTIDVLPNVQGNRLFKLITPGKGSHLDGDSLAEIRSLPEIKQVYPEYTVRNLVKVEGRIFGQTLQTDSVIFAVDEDFIASELPEKIDWDKAQEPIPFLISSRLLDIYNFTIAQTNNLPLLRAEDFLGREVDIHLGASTLFPNLGTGGKTLRGRIVGFSPRVDLIGITVPLNSLSAFGPPENQILNKIHALVNDEAIIGEVASRIESLGYLTDYPQKRLQGLEKKLSFIFLGLSLISLTILVLVGLSILNIFLAATRERRHEIGVLRSLGASKKQILSLFLAEAGLIGFCGGIIGLTVGGGAAFGINLIVNRLPFAQSEFLNHSLVILRPQLLIASLFGSIVLSLFAALIPAYKAADLDPVQALKN